MTIYLAISFILVFVLVGILLLAVLGILTIVFLVIAAIKANEGDYYVYPITMRFIK